MKKLLILLVMFVAVMQQALMASPAIGGTDYTEATQRSGVVLDQIIKVNNYWQAHNTPYVRSFWDHAAYHTGNMEAYRLTGRADWYAYTDKWCRHNEWKGAKSDDRKNWKYKTYGEGQDFVLFGDWQICFQTYIDMYNLVPAPYKVARAIEVMSHECSMEDTHFWWWADALYMVMPVMTKMYLLTGEVKYLEKLYENFLWSDSLMYDKDEQLYYRDAKYIYPKVKTACNGGKSFWARGDGWVLAGLAKVLADMPQDYKNRPIFVQRFRELAEGVARVQRPGGYWSRSMLCEDDAPGPETSGTAFFTYGMLWGVNHGYLDKATFEPVIMKAWKYLSETALQPDGSIGFVQPIGEKPDPTKTVDAHSQAPFGTGAWLLAACEMVRYINADPLIPAPNPDAITNSIYHHTPGTPTVSGPINGGAAAYTGGARAIRPIDRGHESFWFTEVKNPTKENISQVIEIATMEELKKGNCAVAREFIVLDSDNNEVPYQITHDGRVLVFCNVRPESSIGLSMIKGQPQDYELTCNGRIYPNRWDDLVWENDRCAWRFYGPGAHKNMKNNAYGFDTFVKNTPHPMQDQLYHNELTSYGVNSRMQKNKSSLNWNEVHRGYTYHRNHGAGMDAYTVGATLGAGAAALMAKDGSLVYPLYYEKAEILDNGPLRFTVRMTMPKRELNGDSIREIRLITQDCGSHFARVEITYEGLDRPTPVCTGIVVHESAPKAYTLNNKEGFVTYAEPLDLADKRMNGEHYLGIFIPQAKEQKSKAKTEVKYLPLSEKRAGGIGHALIQTTYTPGQPFIYYTGSAWSLYDVPTHAIWQETLRHEARILFNGLQLVAH
ncbi:MAG: glycoside hydrolase family 88 protein [Bacteroidaceae bacterium]|nr:glycoside hydrolase family 88 protein [Bacteroidaceae bacterium]